MLAKSEEERLPRACWPCCADGLQLLPIGEQLACYMALHFKIFGGSHPYGLPPRPKRFADVDMTALEFLRRHRLTSLVGLLRYMQQAQGYGVLETVPAFYMLWWIHPKLAEALLAAAVGKGKAQITMLTDGYQPLWRAMAAAHAARHGLRVLTQATVTAVSRGGDAATVRYQTPTGGEVEERLDKVIFAVNLASLGGALADLTAEEAQIFGELRTVTLATTLYEAEPVAHEHAVEFWFSRMQQGEADGRMYAHRNSRPALGPKSAPPAGGRERRVAYQHANRPPVPADGARLRAQLEADLETSGERGVAVLQQRVWSNWPNESLRKGRPWRVLELQGARRSLFIGSSVCFESALDVVAYNEMLAARLRL